MLYHACFSIAVANCIVFLCATLKDRSVFVSWCMQHELDVLSVYIHVVSHRKLMTLKQWLWVQLIVLIPAITTATDLATAGGAVSINPTEIYAGFI